MKIRKKNKKIIKMKYKIKSMIKIKKMSKFPNKKNLNKIQRVQNI